MFRSFRILNLTTVISLGITCYIFYFVHRIILNNGRENEQVFMVNNINCNHSVCPTIFKNTFNVHVIPHSHMDISWLKTFDEYYNGSSSSVDKAHVKVLLNSLIKALQLDSNRMFTISEIAYFSQWWNDIDEHKRKVVRRLVEKRQLQFASGGFVINDEASTHYSAIIDQMTFGLKFINSTFGSCARPTVGWQLDTYGHSKEMAYLLKEMNFKAIFLSRVPENVLHSIALDGYQFLWNTTANNNSKPHNNSILTITLPDGYCTPQEFCVDPRCGPNQQEYKILAKNFITYVKERMLYYNSGHMVIPLGCDFHFQQASRTFGTFDRILNYANENQQDFKAFYSTPNCYLQSIISMPSTAKNFDGDLFPFYDNQVGYWIGFYSTRPIMKYHIRKTNNLIRTTKKITSLSETKLNRKVAEVWDLLVNLDKSIAMMQHHDTITGTSRRCVIKSNLNELLRMQIVSKDILVSGLDSIMKLRLEHRAIIKLSDCPLLNISYCEITDNIAPNGGIALLIYNSLPYKYSAWVSIPVNVNKRDSYEVTDIWKMLLAADLLPIDKRILTNKERPANSKARFNIVFKADLTELGYTIFEIKRKRRFFWDTTTEILIQNSDAEQMVSISNKFVNLNLNLNSDLITVTKKGYVNTFSLNIKCYCINAENSNVISGVYISVLRDLPKPLRAKPLTYTLNGTLVKEIRRRYKKGISIVIRLYADEDWVEIEWSIGGIIQTTKYNNEFILVYKSEMLNNNIFYTDSNGRQLIKRTVHSQSTMESNYYPAVSHVLMGQENGLGMLIHIDRSHGVGGRDGESLEIMVNRILITSDEAGFSESLRDFGPENKYLTVTGKNWLEFDNMKQLKINHRIKSNEIFNSPQLFVKEDYIKDVYLKLHRGVNRQPRHLHILTLEPFIDANLNSDRHLLRLENLKDFSGNELLDKKNTLTVNIRDMFEGFVIVEMVKMSLSADKELATESEKKDSFIVTLRPMEIVTLLIKMVHFYD